MAQIGVDVARIEREDARRRGQADVPIEVVRCAELSVVFDPLVAEMARRRESAVEEPELLEDGRGRGGEDVDAGAGLEEVIRASVDFRRERELVECMFDVTLQLEIVVRRGVLET